MYLQLPKPLNAVSAVAAAMKLSVVVWVLLAVAAVFVMTLGTDEAWVLNGLRSSLRPQVDHLTTELIVTSGGPFALANLAIEWAAGSRVWVHRLVSLCCLGLSFALILRRGGREVAPGWVAWLMLAPLMAVPGAAEVGTAALGTSMGLVLMLAAMVVWASPGVPMARRVIGCGLLYGLAAASRFDLILFGPAVLLVSCMRLEGSRRLELRLNLPAWFFVGIGVAVFLLNQWAMSLPANAMPAADVSASAGLDPWSLNYPKLLNQWFTLTTFASLSLLAAMAAAAFWWPQPMVSADPAGPPRLESLLLAAAVMLLASWWVRAPIPHLRYAFPALFCFAAVAALGLQQVVIRAAASGSTRQLLLCLCLGLACLLGSIGTSTRSLVMSDSDYASWEWTHEMAYDYFRRFEAREHQHQAATYLRDGLPAEARLYSYVPYALRYLTERPIVAVDKAAASDSTVFHPERYLVLTPAIGTYFYVKPESATWVHDKTQLVKQIGRYSVYKLPAGNDSDLSNLKVSRSNYDGHPDSAAWFGRRPAQ